MMDCWGIFDIEYLVQSLIKISLYIINILSYMKFGMQIVNENTDSNRKIHMISEIKKTRQTQI